MRHLIFSFLLIAFATASVSAQEAMTAEEFDAYSQGKTLYFGLDGRPYGAEEYLPNRRVRWSFLDGKCKMGQWFVDLGLICFVYEDTPEPQCWSFFAQSRGLKALFENEPESTTLYEVEQSREPLLCLGPDVGV